MLGVRSLMRTYHLRTTCIKILLKKSSQHNNIGKMMVDDTL